MKFILQESKKFILDERFILVEASSLADIKKLVIKNLTAVTTQEVISNLKKLLGGNIDEAESNTADEISKAYNEVTHQFDIGETDLNIIKGKINDYLKLVRIAIENSTSAVGSAINSVPEIKKLIAALQANIDSNPTKDEDKEKLVIELKTNFAKLAEVIISAVEDKLSETTDGDAYSELIDEAVQDITEIKNKISGINADEQAIITNLEKFNKTIEPEIKSLLDYIKNNNGEDAYDNLINIKDYCTNLTDKLNFDKVSETGTDWDSKFKAAGSDTDKINTVWNNYYSSAWGKDADKVKALGPTFRTELTHGGFSERTNPFITFIKNNINTLNLNAFTYPAVHNAYVSNFISQADLRNKDANNILYNKNLYEKQPKDILEYFSFQSKIFNNFDSRIDKITNIYTTKEKLAKAILDAAINITENNFPDTNDDLKAITNFKSLGQVSDCMTICFGNSSLSKRTVKAEAGAGKLLQDIKDKNIDVKKAIMALAMKGGANSEELVNYVKTKGIGKAPDEPDIIALEGIFSNYNLGSVKKLIKELAIAAGIASEDQLKD